MIKRIHYLEQIRPFYNIDIIKVITGMRRSGKSVLMSQIADEIEELGIPKQHIIQVNFELLEFSNIKTAQELNDFAISKKIDNDMYYFFFDEIQNVEKFELAINSLRAMGNASIFITGSNAHILSSDLSTHLSGRYVDFKILPFKFSEVIEMTKAQDLTKAFDDFMKWGGLPGRFIFDNETETQKYLTSVYDSIVLRDIVSRANVRDINLLDNIFKFLIDNTGNFFSASKITAYLKSTSRSISAETLYSYIHHIIASMLVSKCCRFDIRGKQVLATIEKHYVADIGILQLKKSNEAKNYGSRFETIVYNELIARGYKIYAGMLRGGEIDFVAEKNGEKTYIQAAYELDMEKTIEREYGAFKMIADEPGEKLLITNETNDYSRNGVKQINIIDWLIEKT